MSNELTITGEHALGPAMSALNKRQRAFVEALFEEPGITFGEAAKRAGYGTATSTSTSLRQIGWYVSQKPEVIDAIKEVSAKLIRAHAPRALQVVDEIMSSVRHKDRLKAAGMVLARVDPEVTRIDATVVHTVEDRYKEEIAALEYHEGLGLSDEQLAKVFGMNGLQRIRNLRAAKAKPIDAQYVEVKLAKEVTGTEGLEDLLK